MKSYYVQFYFWLSKTPYRSLERAYKTSKKIQYIKKDYFSYKNKNSSSRRSWQAIMLYINTNLNNYVFIIYCSLLEYKISLFVLSIINNLVLNISNFFNSFFSKVTNYFLVFIKFIPQILMFPQFYFFSFWKNIFNFFFFFSPKNFLNKIENKMDKIKIDCKKKIIKIKTSFILTNLVRKDSKKIEQMNKKLAWIEASLNDLDTWKNYYSFSFFSFEKKNLENTLYFLDFEKIDVTTAAYESIGLVPRSITRTLSGFQAELTGQSTSLVLQDFQISRYQALASVQYMLFLFSFPWGFSIFFKIWFLEPWLKNWWNTYQFQIFLNSFQQEIALKRLQEIEELIWLDKIMVNSLKEIKSYDLNIEIHQKTIQLVKIYNENSLNTLLQLLTDIIYFIILSAVFILGKKRLAILNSWIQELFYSLSDTMKAFFILLLTDLCIGFHSPHGWEIVIGSFLEHLGFAHNKHIISCFVSTFPVILDTVFKYWIFRHLNRISPSIVATYHTMNE
uniref:Potassium/proton antiporter CemA n=1 Tax=Hygroamblystegium humile TaxID=2779698 RepID=A0A6M8NZV3_9BRYO|nr:envelope membrane protein [Hygroamblystegium varium var. humile]QKG04864.1 envelope membrane protein [Hygroamblystegium varium var. humile]